MTISTIALWHRRTRPNRTYQDFNAQLGCHFEEICEMLETLRGKDADTDDALTQAFNILDNLAGLLKTGASEVHIATGARKEFLDSLCDQVVTAIGVGHCAGFNMPEAIGRVDSSNWSKFDADGQPIRDPGGKIKKGPNYEPPNLEGLY